MKAYAYLRVSGHSQLNGDGFPRQRAAIEKYAEKNGVEIVRWFEDGAVSGTRYERPALADMLVALEENGIGVHTVLVEKMDRLARELYVQEGIIRDLAKVGARLISATEGEVDEDPMRVMIRQVLGAIAEYDKKMLVERLAAARRRKREREGRCGGVLPYGDDPKLPHEKQYRELIVRYANSAGIAEAVKFANNRGWPTRQGGKWKYRIVQKMLERAISSCESGSTYHRQPDGNPDQAPACTS